MRCHKDGINTFCILSAECLFITSAVPSTWLSFSTELKKLCDSVLVDRSLNLISMSYFKRVCIYNTKRLTVVVQRT